MRRDNQHISWSWSCHLKWQYCMILTFKISCTMWIVRLLCLIIMHTLQKWGPRTCMWTQWNLGLEITTLLSNVEYGDHITVCLRYPKTPYYQIANLKKLKQRGAVEYVPLFSVATYSNTPGCCSGFKKELKVEKHLFELFPSFSREPHFFLTIGSTPNGSRVQPYAGARRFSTCSQDSACGAGRWKAAHVVFRALWYDSAYPMQTKAVSKCA